MFPDTLMNVIEHASVPTIAAYMPMFRNTVGLKKYGEASEKNVSSTTSAVDTVISEEASPVVSARRSLERAGVFEF